MTKPLADGDVVTRTYSDLEDVSSQNMNRLMDVILDLKDGDTNTDTAFAIALQLYKDEAERLRIMTLLRHKHINDAELLAQRLAAVNKQAG